MTRKCKNGAHSLRDICILRERITSTPYVYRQASADKTKLKVKYKKNQIFDRSYIGQDVLDQDRNRRHNKYKFTHDLKWSDLEVWDAGWRCQPEVMYKVQCLACEWESIKTSNLEKTVDVLTGVLVSGGCFE